MPMHEIEGLIEDSVLLVAMFKFFIFEKRDFLYNLYKFQVRFDTGHTHFRSIETLRELKFTYRLPLEKYRDFKDNQKYFEELDIDKTY